MHPIDKKSGIRLFLYIAINTIPAIVKWLTLTFDTSPRGLAILAFETLLTALTTWRAYMDSGGLPPKTLPAEPAIPPATPDAGPKPPGAAIGAVIVAFLALTLSGCANAPALRIHLVATPATISLEYNQNQHTEK
jgi:hypothetical protein